MTGDPHARLRQYVKTLSSKAWDDLRSRQDLEPALIDSRGCVLGDQSSSCGGTQQDSKRANRLR